MSSDADRYRLGFDIGGTFTDFVLVDVEMNLGNSSPTPNGSH